MSEFRGKVAIVTGGSAGIGRAAAMALVAQEAAVVMADIDVERRRHVRTGVATRGESCRHRPGSLGSHSVAQRCSAPLDSACHGL
jgi:NAD(P)-dependent dehydrogenase (short-subunit alcohol dehydrogenase family)